MVVDLSERKAISSIEHEALTREEGSATTNVFFSQDGSRLVLGDFGLADRCHELSLLNARLAREVADEFSTPDRPRFVIGSVGPGTRLPSLGHIEYQRLEDALTIQASGLIAGGVDAILIETCQDPLQIKAAVNGAKRSRAEAPICCAPSRPSFTEWLPTED